MRTTPATRTYMVLMLMMPALVGAEDVVSVASDTARIVTALYVTGEPPPCLTRLKSTTQYRIYLSQKHNMYSMAPLLSVL